MYRTFVLIHSQVASNLAWAYCEVWMVPRGLDTDLPNPLLPVPPRFISELNSVGYACYNATGEILKRVVWYFEDGGVVL